MTGEGHFTASSLKDLPVRRKRANPPPRSPKYPHFPGCRLHHGLGSAPAAPAARRGGGRGAEGWEDSGGGEVGTETRTQTWRKSPHGQDFSSVCGFRTAQVRWVRVMWPFRVRCVGFSTFFLSFFLPLLIYLFKVPPSPFFFSRGAKNRGKISSWWSGEKGRRGKESISPCKIRAKGAQGLYPPSALALESSFLPPFTPTTLAPRLSPRSGLFQESNKSSTQLRPRIEIHV